MWIKNLKIVIPILVVLAAAIVWFATSSTLNKIGRTTVQPALAEKGEAAIQATPSAEKTYKILHVMSFHSPWEWTDSQFNNFKDAFQGVPVEFKVYQMDAKRQSSKEHLEQAGKEARQIIETWKPDLVYISDDPGMVQVTTHYLNQKLPIVFSGVNADPQDYKLDGVSNVTGVLEREHVVETVRLLKKLIPNVHRIALVSDTAPMWVRAINRAKMYEKDLQAEGVEIVSYNIPETFEQLKQTIKDFEGKVDAFGHYGIFEFKDENGKNVPYQEVQRWIAENSKVPDFSFWLDRVSYGSLCAVSVSAVAQGQDAGKIARGILVDGKSPSSFPMLSTAKGEPIISLARAKQMGITPTSDVLLTARVITKYKWNE